MTNECALSHRMWKNLQSINCAVGILHGNTVEELQELRELKHALSDAHLTPILSFCKLVMTLILTNVHEIVMDCIGNEQQKHQFELIGNVELKLSCGCLVKADGVVLDEPFPCMNKGYNFPSVTHEIPFLWTKN
jgi:hypothetical protein